MNVTIVEHNSGNISSVINSFKEVAKDKVNIEVTSDLKKIKSSDKVVLPGQGSFKSCVDALTSINGLVDTLNEFAINDKKPLLGICVGLQMFADIGYEETETKGLIRRRFLALFLNQNTARNGRCFFVARLNQFRGERAAWVYFSSRILMLRYQQSSWW